MEGIDGIAAPNPMCRLYPKDLAAEIQQSQSAKDKQAAEEDVTAHIDYNFGFELDVEEIVAGRLWVNALK